MMVKATPQRQVNNRGIGVAVIEYLQKHAGQALFVSDIAADLNVEPRVVQVAISNARNNNTGGAATQIETLIRGRQFRWNGGVSKHNGRALFEEIGKTKSGDLLVESEDGIVYKLVEL